MIYHNAYPQKQSLTLCLNFGGRAGGNSGRCISHTAGPTDVLLVPTPHLHTTAGPSRTCRGAMLGRMETYSQVHREVNNGWGGRRPTQEVTKTVIF